MIISKYSSNKENNIVDENEAAAITDLFHKNGIYELVYAKKGAGTMSETLTPDYDAINDAVTRLQAEGNNINNCIDRMRAVIYQLPEIWEENTCDIYVDQYLELEPKMKEMADLITDMAKQMNQICSNFQGTDSGTAG